MDPRCEEMHGLVDIRWPKASATMTIAAAVNGNVILAAQTFRETLLVFVRRT